LREELSPRTESIQQYPYDGGEGYRDDLRPETVNPADMQEKPTVALALLAAWTFWFLFFLYLGV